MQFDRLENWKNEYRHDGMLYFTQRIKEMLAHNTSHIYKVPVLNTYYLIEEYLEIASLVKRKIINENHLKYIMEEFQYSFLNDIVIKENISEDKGGYILQRLNSSSQANQEQLMRYLLHYLGDYNLWCKEYLKKIVVCEKEKKKIEKALKCYLPGLICGGYSQEFIYYFNRKIFVEENVDSIDSLSTFLERFDFQERNYDVYIAIEKRAEQFEEILSARLNVEFNVHDAFSEKLRCDREKYVIIKKTVQALDEQIAARKIYENLDLFFRYYKFLSNRKDNWLFKKGMVIDEQNEIAFLDLKQEGYVRVEETDDIIIGEVSEMLITALLRGAHCSFPIIDKAVVLHNTAIEIKDLKNMFLNLWSALEVLFISEQNDSKIKEIEDKLFPILQKDYLLSLFNILETELSENMEDGEFEKILESLGDGTQCNKIASLVLLEENKNLRQELYQALKDLPLIRSRISQMNENFKVKKDLIVELERYTNRIRWHLRRLYRTRNAIIHSGDKPKHLKELCDHLHSYVDSALLEIAVLLAHDRHLCTIENVLMDVKFNIDDIIKKYDAKNKICKEDIDLLCAG